MSYANVASCLQAGCSGGVHAASDQSGRQSAGLESCTTAGLETGATADCVDFKRNALSNRTSVSEFSVNYFSGHALRRLEYSSSSERSGPRRRS
jgi:hypothetical protein